MSMKLKDLRDWINQLPVEFDDFDLVNGERGMYDEEYSYRIDKPIVTLDVDEGTKEVIFLHQNANEWKNHLNDIPRESITSKEAEEELEALIEEDIANESMSDESKRLIKKWEKLLNGQSIDPHAIIIDSQEQQLTNEEMKKPCNEIELKRNHEDNNGN